jgi:hypothetical protein
VELEHGTNDDQFSLAVKRPVVRARRSLMSIFKGVGRNFPTPLSGAKSDEVVQGRRRTRWTSVDML